MRRQFLFPLSSASNQVLFLFFFFFLLLSSASRSSSSSSSLDFLPRFTDASYEIRKGSLLSDEFKVAVVKLEASEPVYLSEYVPCFSCWNNEKQKNEKDYCVCDYSKKGSKCGSDCKCFSSEGERRKAEEDEDDEERERFCSSELQDFETLEDYKPIHKTLKGRVDHYFRYHHDNPCKGFFVKVRYDYGFGTVLASTTSPQPTFTDFEMTSPTLVYGRTEILVCPESKMFRPGTYFFTFSPATEEVSFTLEIITSDEIKEEENKVEGNKSNCEDEEDRTCIKDGVPLALTMESGATTYFKYLAEGKEGECIRITTVLLVNDGDGDLYMSLTSRNPFYDVGWYGDYTSFLRGTDLIELEECFSKSETKELTVVVDPWFGGNFSLTVTTEKLKRRLVPLSSLGAFQAPYSLWGSFVLNCPNNAIEKFTCSAYFYDCLDMWFPFASSKEVDVFWPPPARWAPSSNRETADLFTYLHYGHESFLLEKDDNSFYIAFLLESETFGVESFTLSEEDFQQCEFVSLHNIYNKEGHGFVGNLKPRPAEKAFNSEGLSELVEVGQTFNRQSAKSTTLTKTLQLAYQINTLLFTSVWHSAIELTNSFLVLKPTEVNVTTTDCRVIDTSSSEWTDDPCCNRDLLNTLCCLPREVLESRIQVTDFNDSTISSSCASTECVDAALEQYVVQTQYQSRCSAFSSSLYLNQREEALKSYRKCRKLFGIDEVELSLSKCRVDEECNSEDGTYKGKCNLVTNKCIPTTDREFKVLECVVEDFDRYTEYFMKEKYDLPGGKNELQYRRALFDSLQAKDCKDSLGHSKSDRLRYIQAFQVCGATDCDDGACLDTSCFLEPSNCIDRCNLEWFGDPTPKTKCNSEEKCNWIQGGCEDHDCSSKCNAPEENFFCGFCSSDVHCVEIPGVNSKEECEKKEACVLLSGEIVFVSEEECKSMEECTEKCPGQSCSARGFYPSICFSYESKSQCGGIWDEGKQFCNYPHLSQELCGIAGFQYQSCGVLSIEECEECSSGGACPLEQSYLECYVSTWENCQDKKECEIEGGYCNDAAVLSFFDVQPPRFGGCLFDPYFVFYQLFALCDSGMHIPQGCLSEEIIDEEDCVEQGGVWRSLASSKKDCIKAEGCRDNLQIRSLSPRTPEVCKECGSDMVSYYKWTAGQWLSPTPVKLSWRKRKLESLYEWSPVFSFPTFQNAIYASVDSRFLSDVQNQALCEFNARAPTLLTTTCACQGEVFEDQTDSISSCFESEDIDIETGTGTPCIGLGAVISTATSFIFIDEGAIDNPKERCVNIRVYTSSRRQLEQPKSISFSPLSRTRDYDKYNVVLNKDRAPIGRVLSDGSKIVLSGPLKEMKVCILLAEEKDPDIPKKFTIYDFSIESNSSPKFLHPADEEVRKMSDEEGFCAVVSDPPLEATYYLIKRVDNYHRVRGSLYSEGETAAWWIFAGTFTTLAVLAFFLALSQFWTTRAMLHPFFIVMFFFFTAMCTIRAIFFYLLADRVLEDLTSAAGGSVVFFLGELPTLLYFTSFTCFISFWIWLYFSNSRNAVVIFSIGFNLFLYIVFLVVIILFRTLPNQGQKSDCEGLLPTENDNSNYEILVIFYQSFMAGVSILLGTASVASGSKFSIWLRKRNKLFDKLVLLSTGSCALGLLLHCSFLLYLAITFSADFTIIVLLVVLSEVVPITYVILQFSVLRGDCFGWKIRSFTGSSVNSSSGPSMKISGVRVTGSVQVKERSDTATSSHSQSQNSIGL